MAAPTFTARQTPADAKLREGRRITIAFAEDPDVSFWEKTVKPPGIDNGETIDQTTQHNTTYKTKAPRDLVDIGNVTSRVAYNPKVYDQAMDLVGVEGAITVHMPNAMRYAFWGYLKSFMPADNGEGTQPEADIEIVVTNWDPDNNVEAGPVFSGTAGT